MKTLSTGAPFFGCCLAGMLIPFMNRKGAVAGLFAPIIPIGLQISSSFISTTCNAESRMLVEHSNLNFTSAVISNSTIEESPYFQQFFYCMSPFMFGLIGLFLFFIISVPVSYFTQKPEETLHKNSPLLIYHTPADFNDNYCKAHNVTSTSSENQLLDKK